MEKTFNEKIIDILLNAGMPSKQGSKAEESGLIVLVNKTGTPVCAAYGSSLDLALTMANVLEQNDGVRSVIIGAASVYMKEFPNDPDVKMALKILKL